MVSPEFMRKRFDFEVTKPFQPFGDGEFLTNEIKKVAHFNPVLLEIIRIAYLRKAVRAYV
jgi:hypothetical protein